MLPPIQTDEQYEAAKKRVAELMDESLQPNGAEAEELGAFDELIEIYERMGPVVFLRAGETVWENEIVIDFSPAGASFSN